MNNDNLNSLLQTVNATGNQLQKIRTNSKNSFMNANGHIMYRRSPTLHPAPSSHLQPQSYETIGSSPSTMTSYNSEGVGDNINSLDDEGQINDLSQKFELLQRQVDILTENLSNQEDIYRRSRQENDVLLTKIHSLEDQMRDLELAS